MGTHNQVTTTNKLASFTVLLLCLNLSTARVGTSLPLSRSLQSSSCYPEVSQIKVQSTTADPIQFFEIQALSAGTNVALNKNATQSSTLDNSRSAVKGVDGNDASFSHTGDGDPSPWFNVDLEGSFNTEFIKIKNRYCGSNPSDPNGCLCRLSNAEVQLFDAQNTLVRTEVIGDTCGVHDVNIDLSTCSQQVSSESAPGITISSATVDEDNSFSVTFGNPMDQTNIYAAVIQNSACTMENSSNQVDSTTLNVVSGSSGVTVHQIFNDLVTTEQKNSGAAKMEFCVRADVWHPEYSSSIIATKVTVGITVTFDQNGSFVVDMEAADFSASYAGYTSTREIDVSATLGQCSSPGNQGPYAIGSTLKFCVKSTVADVVVSGLQDVSFTDSNGNEILGIVDSIGDPSFVTTIAGLDSKSVDVSTMMATAIYDQGFGGSTINLQGTVSVSYVNAGRRQLLQHVEQQNRPFALSVVVAGDKESEAAKSNPTGLEEIDYQSYVMYGVIPVMLIGGLAYVFINEQRSYRRGHFYSRGNSFIGPGNRRATC